MTILQLVFNIKQSRTELPDRMLKCVYLMASGLSISFSSGMRTKNILYLYTCQDFASLFWKGFDLGVVNGKCKTTVFLCETETISSLWIARPRFRSQNGFAKNLRLRDVQNCSKNETARLVNFEESFARPCFFQRPFTSP